MCSQAVGKTSVLSDRTRLQNSLTEINALSWNIPERRDRKTALPFKKMPFSLIKDLSVRF